MLKKIITFFVGFGISVFIGLFFVVTSIQRTLPDIKSLDNFSFKEGSKIFDSSGKTLLYDFTLKKQKLVAYEDVPDLLKKAFLSAEDANFFKHKGIDIYGILRALIKNLKTKKFSQGGSTITQQLAKTFLDKREKTIFRKIQDIILAISLEKKFSKEEILNFYMNYMYFGRGYYGIYEAAKGYFSKELNNLTIAEMTLLAGLLVAPGKYAPHLSSKNSKIRQEYVLDRMKNFLFITSEEYLEAKKELIKIHPTKGIPMLGGYFTEHVRRILLKEYSKSFLEDNPLRIVTTVQLPLQAIAQKRVEKEAQRLDSDNISVYETVVDNSVDFLKQQQEYLLQDLSFYISPEGEKNYYKEENILKVGKKYESVLIFEGGKYYACIGEYKVLLVKNFLPFLPKPFKKNLKVLVQILTQETAILIVPGKYQGALMSMHIPSGEVISLVGGRDFFESSFDRAIQAKRQVGSVFKPFVYVCALQNGFTNNSILWDLPQSLGTSDENIVWKPSNVDKTFKGKMTFREAIESSRNIPTLKILETIGLNKMRACLNKFDLQFLHVENLGFAIGNFEMTLESLLSAYSIFPGQGYKIQPMYIKSINDTNYSSDNKKVLDPNYAYLGTSLLEGVVLRGTGGRALRAGYPIAGKTGTTNNWNDAWFLGFSKDILTGVWYGNDKNSSLGSREGGSKTAIPTWVDFMKEIFKIYPPTDFEIPEDLTTKKINYHAVNNGEEKIITEYFIPGSESQAIDLEQATAVDDYYDSF